MPNKIRDKIEDSEENAAGGPGAAIPQNGTGDPDRLWLLSAGLITALAAFLRFFWLDLRPLHHDEGVNGHFLTTLFREGVYHYEPSNYHGPDLYYLALAFTKVFGLNTTSVRWSVAVFGLLTVILAFYLHRYIGKIGSLAAALLLAVSPGMVFISRYFIHEILFIFLSLSIVVSVLFFLDRRKAGAGAAVWVSLLMAMCFMPATAMGVAAVAGKNTAILWGSWIVLLVVEAVLIFFVTRMLMQWQHGRPIYLILASASAVLLYATKETAFITHGTMAIAVACVIGWRRLLFVEKVYEKRRAMAFGLSGAAALTAFAAGIAFYDSLRAFGKELYLGFAGGEVGQSWLLYAILLLGAITALAWFAYVSRIGKGDRTFDEPGFQEFAAGGWQRLDTVLAAVSAVFVFVYLLVLFFTSFFHYPSDFWNFFTAYAFWAKTGSQDHTQNGYGAYLKWLLQTEAPIVFLSVLGTLFAVIKGRHKFALFSGLWAFGLFLAYTIISYKTPWLALSFTLPMCIIGGYAVNELVGSRQNGKRIIGIAVSVLSIPILTFQTYDLNFVRYDDEAMPYVYAHTRRGFEDLVTRTKEYAEKSGKNEDATIEIVSGEYWPMPWYFNDYPNARFHGKLVEANTSEIVIAHSRQAGELPAMYSRHYKYIEKFPLRPGVELLLLVRNDIAGPEGRNLYEIGRTP